jgi:hypothetical protein
MSKCASTRAAFVRYYRIVKHDNFRRIADGDYYAPELAARTLSDRSVQQGSAENWSIRLRLGRHALRGTPLRLQKSIRTKCPAAFRHFMGT